MCFKTICSCVRGKICPKTVSWQVHTSEGASEVMPVYDDHAFVCMQADCMDLLLVAAVTGYHLCSCCFLHYVLSQQCEILTATAFAVSLNSGS